MKITELLSHNLSYDDINELFEAVSYKEILLQSVRIPNGYDEIYEGMTLDEINYIQRFENELLPLMEGFIRYIKEAEFTPDQINQLFGSAVDKAEKSGKNRTKLGQVADVSVNAAKWGADKVAKLNKWQNDIRDTMGTFLQDSKPIKKADERYDRAVARLENAVGGPDSKISQATKWIGNKLKDHPIWAGGIVAALTLLGTLALGTGPLTIAPFVAVTGLTKAGVIGFFLRMLMELLKGEKLSTAAGKGLWGAMVGIIARMGVDQLEHLIGDPMIKNVYTAQAAKDPGVSISSYRVSINVLDNGQRKSGILEFIGTPQEIGAIENIIKKAEALIETGKLEQASNLLDKLSDQNLGRERLVSRFTGPDGDKTLSQIVSHFVGKELAQQSDVQNAIMKVATDFESNVRTLANGLKAAAQAGAAGFAGSKKPTAEPLEEIDLKAALDKTKGKIAGSKLGKAVVSRSAEFTNIVTLKKLQTAWENAGKPTDSTKIVPILQKAGVSDEIIKSTLTDMGMDPSEIETHFVKAAEPGTAEVPFKSGNAELDAEAEKIFKEEGIEAFTKYWEGILTKHDQPIGTIISRKDGRWEKIGDNRWKNLDTNVTVRIRNVTKANTAAPKSTNTAAQETKPIGTIVSTPSGRFKKEAENRWRNVDSGKIAIPAVAKGLGLTETASGGSSSSGSVASVAAPLGAVIRRMPAGQSFFGGPLVKTRKKRRKQASMK